VQCLLATYCTVLVLHFLPPAIDCLAEHLHTTTLAKLVVAELYYLCHTFTVLWQFPLCSRAETATNGAKPPGDIIAESDGWRQQGLGNEWRQGGLGSHYEVGSLNFVPLEYSDRASLSHPFLAHLLVLDRITVVRV
jgi:hypothetical protein